MAPSILLVDSYDSFTYNVADALRSLGAIVDVVPRDAAIEKRPNCYDAFLLGPGPGAPQRGDRLSILIERILATGAPMLGICLGMQAIAEHYGACVVRAPAPVHGEVASIAHDGQGLFERVPSPLNAARYHSLCVERASLPESLAVRAVSGDGVVQAIEDRQRPVYGLQFHPESFLSEHGERLLSNFLVRVRG
jgi:anthranilate synthase/aminodeoxychorismate synthase-like glutamine amidotransferase